MGLRVYFNHMLPYIGYHHILMVILGIFIIIVCTCPARESAGVGRRILTDN